MLDDPGHSLSGRGGGSRTLRLTRSACLAPTALGARGCRRRCHDGIVAHGRARRRGVGKDASDNVRKALTTYPRLHNFEVSVAARLNIDKRQTNGNQFRSSGLEGRAIPSRCEGRAGNQQDLQSRRQSA